MLFMIALIISCRHESSQDAMPRPGGGESPRPNLVLIVLDTTRADRIGCYGSQDDPTPSLDSLATSGIRFAHAISQSSWTKPSFASLLTGVYPYHIPQENKAIGPRNITLAEHLKRAGYFTIGVATNIFLQTSYGLNQGFDVYLDHFPLGARSFPAALEELQPWLDLLDGLTPFFLFLQIFEPHFPYEPPKGYADRFALGTTRFPDLYPSLCQGQIGKRDITENRIGMDKADVAYFSELYQGEIAYSDWFIGKLCRHLRVMNLASTTFVIVTADHGESLGENDYYFEHGDYLTEDQVHVPLIFSYPKTIPAGLVIHQTVPIFAIYPTVLDLLGVPTGSLCSNMEATSLATYVLGDSLPPEDLPVLAMSGQKIAILRRKWKLITDENTGKERLYNLKSTAQESVDLLEETPDHFMKSLLSEDLKRFHRGERITGSLADMATLTDPDDLDALRALGYVNDD